MFYFPRPDRQVFVIEPNKDFLMMRHKIATSLNYVSIDLKVYSLI